LNPKKGLKKSNRNSIP